MQLLQNAVGRKMVMMFSGVCLLAFVFLHLVGNPFSPNAFELPDIGRLYWLVRLGLLILLVLHIYLGIKLTLENKVATPDKYAVKVKQKATFSSENMIVTGLIVLAFLVYHLLQFVFGVVEGDLSVLFVRIAYIVAGLALMFHLFHGVGSFIQTLGWNNERSLAKVMTMGKVLSMLILVTFVYVLIQG